MAFQSPDLCTHLHKCHAAKLRDLVSCFTHSGYAEGVSPRLGRRNSRTQVLSASVGWHIQAGVSTVLRLVCDMLAKREQDGDGIVSEQNRCYEASHKKLWRLKVFERYLI